MIIGEVGVKEWHMHITGILQNGLANRGAGRMLGDHLEPQVATATFTIGAEAADAIVVTVQLKKLDGTNATERKAIELLILKADETDFNANAYTVASSANGKVAESVANKVLVGYTTATGVVDVSLTIVGAATAKLAVVLPGGKMVVSDTITHVV